MDSPCGSYGDPALATAKKGAALVEAMLEELALCVREIAGKLA